MVDLSTTNTMLTIMAIVSVLEALVVIGIAVAGFMVYRRVMQLLADFEVRQIAPIRERVDAILADVKTVTERVNQQTARVDDAISDTMNRVDETAERVRGSVRDKVSQATGVVRGIRAVIASIFNDDARRRPGATAAGGL